MNRITDHKLIFFGETNFNTDAMHFLQSILDRIVYKRNGMLHVVMEHFTLEMEMLQRSFSDGSMSFEKLVDGYK